MEKRKGNNAGIMKRRGDNVKDREEKIEQSEGWIRG